MFVGVSGLLLVVTAFPSTFPMRYKNDPRQAMLDPYFFIFLRRLGKRYAVDRHRSAADMTAELEGLRGWRIGDSDIFNPRGRQWNVNQTFFLRRMGKRDAVDSDRPAADTTAELEGLRRRIGDQDIFIRRGRQRNGRPVHLLRQLDKRDAKDYDRMAGDTTAELKGQRWRTGKRIDMNRALNLDHKMFRLGIALPSPMDINSDPVARLEPYFFIRNGPVRPSWDISLLHSFQRLGKRMDHAWTPAVRTTELDGQRWHIDKRPKMNRTLDLNRKMFGSSIRMFGLPPATRLNLSFFGRSRRDWPWDNSPLSQIRY